MHSLKIYIYIAEKYKVFYPALVALKGILFMDVTAKDVYTLTACSDGVL